MNTENKTVTTYASILLLTFFALFAIKIFNVSYPLEITTTSRSSELAVIGEGKVEIVPDTAYVDVGITVNNARTVVDAQNTINATNNQILSQMKSLGIKKEDIKTSNYSINPDYSYEGNTSRIRGYNGTVTLSIKVTKLDLISQVIEKATSAGANQVQGTRFEVDKPEKYREQAREEAIANAKEQAQKLAKNLGITLGRVVNIVELSPQDTIPQPYFKTAQLETQALGGGGPTIEPGTQTITSTVTLYFEKK